MANYSLAGWSRVLLADGLLLAAPERGAGRIRVRTHEQPLRPLLPVLEELGRRLPAGYSVTAAEPARRLVTDEGEYALFVRFRGSSGERQYERSVGVIVGDDALAIIEGIVEKPDSFDMVRHAVEAMTIAYGFGLGANRWRRFFYDPPPGWNGLPRHRADLWLAPGYPKNPAVITVFHARPEATTRVTEQHFQLFEGLPAERTTTSVDEPKPIKTRAGTLGQLITRKMTVGGEVRRVGDVGFADGRYVYHLRLETDDDHRPPNTVAFVGVVESLETLPLPRADVSSLIHWFETN